MSWGCSKMPHITGFVIFGDRGDSSRILDVFTSQKCQLLCAFQPLLAGMIHQVHERLKRGHSLLARETHLLLVSPVFENILKILLRQLSLMQTQLMKKGFTGKLCLDIQRFFNLVKWNSAPRRKTMVRHVGNRNWKKSCPNLHTLWHLKGNKLCTCLNFQAKAKGVITIPNLWFDELMMLKRGLHCRIRYTWRQGR